MFDKYSTGDVDVCHVMKMKPLTESFTADMYGCIFAIFATYYWGSMITQSRLKALSSLITDGW